MSETKISWENHPQGTVSAWINQETRKILKQLGEPNPGYVLEWRDELADALEDMARDIALIELKPPDRGWWEYYLLEQMKADHCDRACASDQTRSNSRL
jgi:hypothetical protein